MNAKIKNVITAMLSAALLASCAIRPGVTGQTETPEVTEAQTETTAIETEGSGEPTQTSKNIPLLSATRSGALLSTGTGIRSLQGSLILKEAVLIRR